MIPAALRDEVLLADIRAADRGDELFRLWWLGQSGFLVQYRGEHLLFDPYLSDSLTAKYAGTSQPHLRMSEHPLAPERLDFVQVVTSSHRHTDHLDGHTLIPLLKANPEMTVIVPRAEHVFSAERLQVAPERLSPLEVGESLQVGAFQIHAVASAHEDLERDEAGNHRYLGYVVQFGDWTVYHSGDTVRHAQLLEQLAPFSIDVALLPINGRGPERHVAGNLWGDEAAQLASDLGVGCVIPCHYAMFSFNSVTPDLFVQTCHRLGQPYAVLRAGERWESLGLRRNGSSG